MLNVTTQALNPQQLKERLEVKYKELEVIRNNFSAVATHAALIAGFANQVMHSERFTTNTPTILKGSFYLTTVSVVGLELYTVFLSTLCVVCGPNLAMRGKEPESSVDMAVQGMMSARQGIYSCFVIGIALFQVTAMQWCIAKLAYDDESDGSLAWAILVSIAIAAFLAVTMGHGLNLYSKYFNSNMFDVDRDWFLFRSNRNNRDQSSNANPSAQSLLKNETIAREAPPEPHFTCQNCGTEVLASYHFCPRCNHNLRAL